MENLTSTQASMLASQFLALAQSIGSFRHQHWSDLSAEENSRLGSLQWSILNAGEDLLALSTTLVMDDVQNSLEQIAQITNEINETISSLASIQKGINIAASIVTLGAAIISKNPGAIHTAISGLVTTWKS